MAEPEPEKVNDEFTDPLNIMSCDEACPPEEVNDASTDPLNDVNCNGVGPATVNSEPQHLTEGIVLE